MNDQTLPVTTRTGIPVRRSALSEKAGRRIAITAAITVVVLAVCAAVLSYAGLAELAAKAGIHPWLTWMFPVVVDGLTLVGSLGVVYAVLSGVSARYPWFLMLAGVALSVLGNVFAVGNVPENVARGVHAIPPIVLALALEEMLRVYRNRARQAADQDAHQAELEAKHAAEEERLAEQARADELARREEERAARIADAEHEREMARIHAQTASLHAATATPDTVSDQQQPEQPEQQPETAPAAPEPATPAAAPARPAPPRRVPATSSSDEALIAELGLRDDRPARDRLADLVAREPDVTGPRAGKLLDVHPRTARAYLKDLREADDTDTSTDAPTQAAAPVATVDQPELDTTPPQPVEPAPQPTEQQPAPVPASEVASPAPAVWEPASYPAADPFAGPQPRTDTERVPVP